MTLSIKCSTYMSIKFGQRCSFGKFHFNFNDNQKFNCFSMILLNKKKKIDELLESDKIE